MSDVAAYLKGFVAGYWSGYDFAVNYGDELIEEEDEDGSAPGDAVASSPATAPAPGSPPLRGSPPGARAYADSSLPAIRQPALPDGVEVAGELEAMYVHRGMVQALATMAEILRTCDMPEAASLCENAVRGVEMLDERR